MKLVITIVLLFPFGTLFSQPYVREVHPFPVQINGQQVRLPFAGGVNSPYHQFVDIDGDGDLDLFVLDVDPPVEFYRNEGTRFAPGFELRNGVIPLPQISRWFLFVDITGDGLLDLITEDSTLSGARVYRNTGTPQSPVFSLVTLQLQDAGGNMVFAGQNSIPALVDIDGDGDLDFFSCNYNGTVNFYENTGSPTNFVLTFRSAFWQNVTIYGDTCTTSFDSPAAHGASSYTFADIRGTGRFDMFIGDIFSLGVFQLVNTGTPAAPHMVCNTSRFPQNQPVLTSGFNKTSFVDIDGNGTPDMFVGVLAAGVQTDGFWFYRNTGTPSSPQLQLETMNFISTIDVGMNAHPAFVDIDGDGRQDMFVGNLNGQLSYFRNTGTEHAPSFQRIDSVFQNITGGYAYAPAFADIDNDGRKDLFLGLYNGRMKFYHNNGTTQVPVFVPTVSPVDSINVSSNAAPAFVDIDGDGDLDLFVGKQDGSLTFYRNNGSPSQFTPVLESSFYQSIRTGPDAFPAFVDIDNDGDDDLFIGTSEGRVEFYENIGTQTNAQFVRRTNHYANTEPMMEAAPALIDIDGDGDRDLFVGTQRGGIQFYRNQLIPSSVQEANVPQSISLEQNYPNPFNPSTTITYAIPGTMNVDLTVFDILGQKVAVLVDERQGAGVYRRVWNGEGAASGVYLYRLKAGGMVVVKKLVLVR